MYDLLTGEWRTPKGNAATFRYRADTNDWNTLTACVAEDEYDLRDLSLTGLALDVGSYLGGVAIGLALDNPGLRVLAIEALPANLELVAANVALNDLGDRVTVLWAAAGAPGVESAVIKWGDDGTEFGRHHAFVGNSVGVSGLGARQLEAEAPGTWLSRLVAAYGPVDLAKVDCEGCEWGFLADPAIDAVPLIVGEWHPTDGHTRDDVLALLPDHAVTFSGPDAGPGGFRAVRRG